MPTIVYKYGLRPPTQETKRVLEQMHLAHEYRNKLTELELKRREEVHQVQLAYPELAELEDEYNRLKIVVDDETAQVKLHKIRHNTRKVPKELRERVKAAKAQKAEVYERLKAVKKIINTDPVAQAKMNAATEEFNRKKKESRAACGCYWGTYLLTENAAEQANESGTPKFVYWKGEGQVGVQIQKGMTVSRLFSGTDTRLQIDPVPDSAWAKKRSKEQRTAVRLRIGTKKAEIDGKKKQLPIWAEWPVTLHRPLPPAADIRWAQVIKKKVANKEKWSLHITLKVPHDYFEETCGGGVVAIDLGWRKQDDTLRVAYMRDKKGKHDPFLLEENVMYELRKVEDLQAIRDQHRDTMRPLISAWIRDNNIPEWLKEDSSHIYMWKSKRRFAHLATKWRDNRFPGDDVGYSILEQWREREEHLWLWEVNLRDQVKRRRLQQYNEFAAYLSRTYDTLVLEEKFLAKMQKRLPPENNEKENEKAKLQQRRACCHELRDCLIQAFVKRGGRVFEEAPAYTTQICHLCGNAEPWDAAKSIEHTCSGCGAVWDQDDNACANLLALFDERVRTGKDKGGARGNISAELRKKKKSKWEKRFEKKEAARKKRDKGDK